MSLYRWLRDEELLRHGVVERPQAHLEGLVGRRRVDDSQLSAFVERLRVEEVEAAVGRGTYEPRLPERTGAAVVLVDVGATVDIAVVGFDAFTGLLVVKPVQEH